MSKTGKIILWVVVAAVVIGGIWWWVASQSSVAAPAVTNENGSLPNSTQTTTATTSYPQGDSDQSIDQDMTSLDAQMNGLNSDNASITQSMNDQPVQQAQ